VRFRTVCVLGLGYIGLPTASSFATHGLRVYGVDTDPQVLRELQEGGIRNRESGLQELARAALASGNFEVGDRPTEAEAFVIAVPTPVRSDRRADLRHVEAAAEAIVPHLRPGNLVMLESTCPPGTTLGTVGPILEGSGLKAGAEFLLAYDVAKATFPYTERVSSTWFKLGFPLTYWSDVLETAANLAALGYGQDPRLEAAWEWVIDKQDADGRWPLQNSLKGKMWIDVERQGKPSKWVTLRALRALKAAGYYAPA